VLDTNLFLFVGYPGYDTMNVGIVKIKKVLEQELGVQGIEMFEDFLGDKKGELNKDNVEELEDHVFEKVVGEKGIERAEEVVDRIKKIRLSYQLKKLREGNKSRIHHRKIYEVLKELGNVSLNLNRLEEAENYFNEMLKISEEFGKKEMIIDSLKSNAELYLVLNDLGRVEENARRMIELAGESGNKVMEGEGIKLAGIVSWRKGDHKEGTDYLTDSLKIFEERDLDEKIASVYRELGDLYVSMEDHDKGVEYYKRAAEFFGRAVMPYERANMLLEVGVIKSEMGKDGAVEYLEMAEEESLENSFFDFAAWSSLNLGEIYLEEGMFKKAEDKSRSALELFQKVEDEHGEGGAKLTLGRSVAGKNELSEAEKILKEALSNFRKLELPESEAEARCRLAEVQKEKGNSDLAEENLEEALKIYDSLDMEGMKSEIEEKLDDLTKQLK